MPEGKEWDVEIALNNRSLTFQELVDHAPEVLHELIERQQSLLLTRGSRVVAKIVPATGESVLKEMLDYEPIPQEELQRQLGEYKKVTEKLLTEPRQIEL